VGPNQAVTTATACRPVGPQIRPSQRHPATTQEGPLQTVPLGPNQAVTATPGGRGVENVVILLQRQTLSSPANRERRPAFRRTIKWRMRSEGRISILKRGYDDARTGNDAARHRHEF